MERLVAAGIEVIALADHNDASWIPIMQEAGAQAGIVVFPGTEVTTGSGSDGIHLIIIGGQSKTASDFDEILAGVCGFGQDHPRFDPRSHTPASAPRTFLQILDALPDDYLVVAPHAFNDNGICAHDTARGDIRWKALHHERLGAVDVGDPRTITNHEGWKARFVRRELGDFPCLPGLPFVSTSDSYCLDDLGGRFTWIRMAEPTLEALRQAFLDHEVRIVCNWDSEHPGSPSPNEVAHGWVEQLSMSGLTTSRSAVEIDLDPRLNVIIGGRGSGKSTVVAAMRMLYGETDRLPPQAQAEFDDLRAAVFSDAQVRSKHRLAHSDEQQSAAWSDSGGSTTTRASGAETSTTTTDFKVRVVNQKELFERAAHSSDDPTRTSRNLLALIDDSLATGSAGPGGPVAFATGLEEAQTTWISAARSYQAEVEATAQREVVVARVEELRRQVAAFDDPDSVARRSRNDLRAAQTSWWETKLRETKEALDEIRLSSLDQLAELGVHDGPQNAPDEPADAEFTHLRAQLNKVRQGAREAIVDITSAAERQMTDINELTEGQNWAMAVATAREDQRRYVAELAALGVDPQEYDRVRRLLEQEQAALEELGRRTAALPILLAQADESWDAIEKYLDERRSNRRALLDQVSSRSQHVRFLLSPAADVAQWSWRVRELLNLRSDGFLSDVPALGNWLWGTEETAERERRLALWREACINGNLDQLASESNMRSGWAQRIADLDAVVRARLGSEIADDVVTMEFLREDGDPNNVADWKPLTTGSPGQRSAAMLSFVLHQGVEPLVLDQPEDDLDTEWITELVVTQLRSGRWNRQIIVITHNANIPVNADAERVVVMEDHDGGIRVRTTEGRDQGEPIVHSGALEQEHIRQDIQRIMEGGVPAFVRRERRYNNELNTYRAALRALAAAESRR
jgi:energy-coupling factor transporter ATP-binding protein EcfA2